MASIRHLLEKAGIIDSAFIKTARAIYRRRQALTLLHRDVRKFSGSEKTRVLAINHYFQGELKAFEAVAGEFPEVSMLPVAPEPYFSEVLHLFPLEVRTADIEYDHPALSGLRSRAREISRRIFSDITAAYKFDCVISPSDSFYWLREFIEVCKEKGVPFIVADKEGTISPASYKTDPPKIRQYYPPLADHFLVWSDRQRLYWEKAGVAPEQIIITGAARSDIFVNMKRRAPKSVIFFDFDLDAYLNRVDWTGVNWTGRRDWKDLRDAFRRAAARVASDFPGVEVIIKCHPQQLNIELADADLAKLPNVRIIRGAEISELMPDAYAVAGFQTTALMEAALAGIPVFYAAWGELFEYIKPEMLLFHEQGYGMTTCGSEDEVVSGISKAISSKGESTRPDASKLEMFFANHDGNCSRRIITELRRISALRRSS